MKIIKKVSISLLILLLAGCIFASNAYANTSSQTNTHNWNGNTLTAVATDGVGFSSGWAYATSDSTVTLSQISVGAVVYEWYLDPYTLTWVQGDSKFSQTASNPNDDHANVQGSYGCNAVWEYKMHSTHSFTSNGVTVWTTNIDLVNWWTP